MDSVWKKSVGLIGLLLLSTSAMTADIGACAEIESVKKRLAVMMILPDAFRKKWQK